MDGGGGGERYVAAPEPDIFEQVRQSAELLKGHSTRDTKEHELADWMVRARARSRVMKSGARARSRGRVHVVLIVRMVVCCSMCHGY